MAAFSAGIKEIKDHPWCKSIDWDKVRAKKTEVPYVPSMKHSNFDPEYVKSYEVGVKAEFMDGDLRVNSSLFYTDYTDLQLLIADSRRVGPFTTNAGEATIKGLEMELSYVTPDLLFVDLAVGYTDAGYDSLNPGAVAAGLTRADETAAAAATAAADSARPRAAATAARGLDRK